MQKKVIRLFDGHRAKFGAAILLAAECAKHLDDDDNDDDEAARGVGAICHVPEIRIACNRGAAEVSSICRLSP